MALSGLDIYKLLPKTNCRQCGLTTCLAFAMQLAKKTLPIEKCPFISPESRLVLESQALPPIKPLVLGSGARQFEIGNETVMYRHEEKFRNPTGIGFIINDNWSDKQILDNLNRINQFKFERVGQTLEVNLVALRQNQDEKRFLEALKLVLENTDLGIVLVSYDLTALRQAAQLCGERKPLIYGATSKDYIQTGEIARDFGLPLVITDPDISKLAQLTSDLAARGVKDMVIDTGDKTLSEKIWDLAQLRRQALKKNNRALGYPVIAIAEGSDPYEEAMEATAYISKYASIVLIKGVATWEALSILTLRQNIYTDPQKPLQIEPKLYPIGKVSPQSPLLVTTNFSLSYYTVLGEVEASKVPAYILSVDTQGMSVLTAWAAEKFNAEVIAKTLNGSDVKETVGHKNLIIPGYVAMISGELEEQSGFKIIVGPKEAAGLPAFLKNLN